MSHIVDSLRLRMKNAGIDAYIVPSFDAHQSEYVADFFKIRKWLTHFTGSAGTAVITQDAALLWTDGRYHTQALTELSEGPFKLIKQGLPGEPTIAEWLSGTLSSDSVIGFDGTCYSELAFQQLKNDTKGNAFKFAIDNCLLSDLWTDRPAFPKGTVLDLPLPFAGESRTHKLNRVRQAMSEIGTDVFIIPNLDDLSWVLNLRGTDMAYCPFVIAYLMINQHSAELFIHEEKLPHDLKQALLNDGILIKPYDAIFDTVSQLEVSTVMTDLSQINAKLFASLPKSIALKGKGDVITHMKSVKSASEIANIRNCQVADGVALLNFLHWLETAMACEPVTELHIAEKLNHFRSQSDLYLGPSFGTIAGYGANAAMMHYSASEENHAELEPRSFLLFDSGGQYLNGTTDITRTLSLGEISEEEKRDYTLTLKSHIGLAKAVFLEGTCGPHLDILARKPMWDNGLDYKCGTGHGLGYVLSVHEGPHTIRCNQNDVPLKPGMLITNEPGVYKPGRHGIRIENTVLVVEDRTTEFGNFFRFETISYCPIDTKPLVLSLLNAEEIDWLNNYHQSVYDALSPHVDGQLLEKLKIWTKLIDPCK